MEWLQEFPAMSRDNLRVMRQTIDGAFKDFTRAYGDAIESAFDPIKDFLIFLEHLLINSPWPIILAVLVGIVYLMSRNTKITIGSLVALCVIGISACGKTPCARSRW
jgi:glycine betaine/proline transport system permease protein